MYAHVKDHAVKNVWCNPEQDNQIILAAKRITKREGEKVSFPIMKRRLPLPNTANRFHVFQIGQLHPKVLGLFARQPGWSSASWKPFSQAVENLPVFCNVYTDAGVSLPLHRTFYMFTDDRALIIAVDQENKSPIDFSNDQVYFRVYTNAYYESSQAESLVRRTRVNGRTIFNTTDTLAAQAEVNNWKLLPGAVFPFVNGHLVHAIDLINARPDDVVEYMYDASVKNVYEFKVEDLKTFSSDLDNCMKYLIHPEGHSGVIDFVDDIDVYVVHHLPNGRYVGRLIHRNRPDVLRMVTHRDYSLRVESFESIASRFVSTISETPIDLQSLYIRVYVRGSGMVRPLIYDNQRIFELYKLSHEQVEQAMVGVDSTVPYWTAAALESSGYAELMRINYNEIDIDVIQRAYGYNSLSKVVGESPLRTRLFNDQWIVELPVVYQENSTVYEYDVNGVLTGFYHHPSGSVYHCRDEATDLVEIIPGLASQTTIVAEGEDSLPVPSKHSYRVYLTYLIDDVPSRAWRDITGTDMYRIEEGILRWNGENTEQWLQVRTDEHFLGYTLPLDQVAGTFYFDLSEIVGTEHRQMEIPMGDLDIWLNGKSLIQNFGYFVDFPRVFIVDKEHLYQPANSITQQVTVRFTGFCDNELKMMPVKDYGFVEHGVLSNNNRYNIRDDKVLRITLDGRLKHRGDLIFSELTPGVSVVNTINGAPYQVKDVIVPMRGFTEEETYRLRENSLAIDKAVEDYLTLKLPEPERDAVSSIPNRHVLYSPFFVHIVNDLANGDFPMHRLEEVLSDTEIVELCQPYEHLLFFDPINPGNNIEQRFVVIHPTGEFSPLGVSLYSYRFLQRLVKLYGRNLINLSPHIVVSFGGS